MDTLEFVGFTGPSGEDILGRVVGDDPLARPAVTQALQERGREALRRMAEANRDWLGPPPEEVRTYKYRFRFAGEEGTTYRVGADPVAGVVRHGISHYSAVHHLAAHPEDATFRRVEADDERIELTYTLKEPVTVSAGDGVQGTWRGFFSRPAREGTLVLDARRHTPLEHRTEDLVETFSQYVAIREGRFAPLAIRVDQESMRFDWTFQVFEPGLWLFASDRGEIRGGRDEDAAVVDRVKVNGAEAKRIAQGRRPE